MNESANLAQVLALPSHSHHHSHQYFQVVIGLQGQTEFDIQGQANLVGPGQGCLVPASADHAFTGVGRNQILVINLADTQHASLQTKIEQLFDHQSYFKLANQSQVLVNALCQEMLTKPQDTMLAEACANTLLCVLQNHLAQSKQHQAKVTRLQMEHIDRYIQQHLQQKITVAQLAGCVFLAESQFHLLFRQQTGLTPHQYLLRKRFNAAKQLLATPQLSIEQISHRCGFASQSSFTSAFSTFYGITPARYRKQAS
ncbi:helix-turn-helix domain-containing protein [Agarivorans sp. B2Z047]|uniref:helix-turn-helix domain-containing protein n=1 Tax=Agarivorans TaxID=261825 RepID=UPI00128CAC71|nr:MULTISPECIES: AraC family transcriptional regulator [Agarivorans]MPW27520.1 helix-turn-helix domain-containing protein [Agarivorans sp. B2Z047]UQN44639.1 AraC family transcriptional regulator [Agarivorans sp. B2Z047]